MSKELNIETVIRLIDQLLESVDRVRFEPTEADIEEYLEHERLFKEAQEEEEAGQYE